MKTWKCGVWCWLAYALPCLVLLTWFATGHRVPEDLRLLVWLYGFPSTALLLPVLSLMWSLNGTTEFVVTTLIAGVMNGATLVYILRLVRNSLKESAEPAVQAVGK